MPLSREEVLVLTLFVQWLEHTAPEYAAAPAMYEALAQCRKAFDAMPADVLGHNEREGWPYLEELTSRVDAILAAARGGS